MFKIAIDLMGGDFSPKEAVSGIHNYLKKESNSHFILIGEATVCQPFLKILDKNRYTFIPSGASVTMHDHPVKSLKEKPDSSIALGFQGLKNTDSDAFISAGSTGAMLVAAVYTLKTIEGLLRPVIAAPIPRYPHLHEKNLLLDVGLNADCKAENLNQFAVLGSLYASVMWDIDRPEVGLLNIGEEKEKGNLLSQAAYALLQENKHIHFIGNIEGRDICTNKARIVIADGFSGNICLKMAESFHTLADLRGLRDDFLEGFNYVHQGGVPVLGINKPVIIGHGISEAPAFENMIHTAHRMLSTQALSKVQEGFTRFCTQK